MFRFTRFIYQINRLSHLERMTVIQPNKNMKYWILPIFAYCNHQGYNMIKEEIK